MKAWRVLAAVGIVCLLYAGCTNVQKGAGAGTVVGAGAGAAIGAIGPSAHGPGYGVAIGAPAGAAAGAVAADQFWDEEKAAGADPEALENAEREKELLANQLDGMKGDKDNLANELDREKANSAQLAGELDNLRSEADKLAMTNEELRKQKEASDKELEELRKGLQGIDVGRSDKGITLTMATEVLFESGKAELKPKGKEMLTRAANVLKQKYPDHEFNIEGHTDNVPISRSKWQSNWELSCGRSLSVLHYLIDDQKMQGEQLSATGYGQTRPVADNKTADGRQKNRRAVIVILPKVEVAKVKLDKEELAAASKPEEAAPAETAKSEEAKPQDAQPSEAKTEEVKDVPAKTEGAAEPVPESVPEIQDAPKEKADAGEGIEVPEVKAPEVAGEPKLEIEVLDE